MPAAISLTAEAVPAWRGDAIAEARLRGDLARHGRLARLVPGSLRIDAVSGTMARLAYRWIATSCCADGCDEGSATLEVPCHREGSHLVIDLGDQDERSTAEEF